MAPVKETLLSKCYRFIENYASQHPNNFSKSLQTTADWEEVFCSDLERTSNRNGSIQRLRRKQWACDLMKLIHKPHYYLNLFHCLLTNRWDFSCAKEFVVFVTTDQTSNDTEISDQARELRILMNQTITYYENEIPPSGTDLLSMLRDGGAISVNLIPDYIKYLEGKLQGVHMVSHHTFNVHVQTKEDKLDPTLIPELKFIPYYLKDIPNNFSKLIIPIVIPNDYPGWLYTGLFTRHQLKKIGPQHIITVCLEDLGEIYALSLYDSNNSYNEGKSARKGSDDFRFLIYSDIMSSISEELKSFFNIQVDIESVFPSIVNINSLLEGLDDKGDCGIFSIHISRCLALGLPIVDDFILSKRQNMREIFVSHCCNVYSVNFNLEANITKQRKANETKLINHEQRNALVRKRQTKSKSSVASKRPKL